MTSLMATAAHGEKGDNPRMIAHRIVVVGLVGALALAPFACSDSLPPPGPSSDACNPVTEQGCEAAGSTCDMDVSAGYFQCYPGPGNTVQACGQCDTVNTFCAPGLTCADTTTGASVGECYQYCCTDADCGAGGICSATLGQSVLAPANTSDGVGLCVQGSANNAASCGVPQASPRRVDPVSVATATPRTPVPPQMQATGAEPLSMQAPKTPAVP